MRDPNSTSVHKVRTRSLMLSKPVPLGCFFINKRLPPSVERKIMSDFYWLKTPPAPSITPGVGTTVSRMNGSRGPGRQSAWYRAPTQCANSSLGFFKEVGSASGVTTLLVCLNIHVWWADASQKRTLCPSWSRIPPWTCQAWVALPHNTKDYWNTQDLQRRQRGDTVGRSTAVPSHQQCGQTSHCQLKPKFWLAAVRPLGGSSIFL